MAEEEGEGGDVGLGAVLESGRDGGRRRTDTTGF